MATVIYLSTATNEIYSDGALSYIEDRKKDITDAASIIGISAGAIAGAMAEEDTAFGFTDKILDLYARSGMDPTEAALTLPLAIAAGPAALSAWQVAHLAQLATTRKH